MLRDPSLTPLTHQHDDALAVCAVLRRSLAAGPTPGNVSKLARRAVDRCELELGSHFQIEEQVLYPACGPMPVIAVLVAEHRTIEGLLAQLRTAPTEDLLEEFCALVARHIRREENELFDGIQRTMPREALDLVGREIESRVARVGP
jgi:iron-sulfur cluster repair protein YtfE (RIC family)